MQTKHWLLIVLLAFLLGITIPNWLTKDSKQILEDYEVENTALKEKLQTSEDSLLSLRLRLRVHMSHVDSLNNEVEIALLQIDKNRSKREKAIATLRSWSDDDRDDFWDRFGADLD